MSEAPSFSRMAAAIRAGDDEAAEREFDALLRERNRRRTEADMNGLVYADGQGGFTSMDLDALRFSFIHAAYPPITAGLIRRMADGSDDGGDVLGSELLDEGRGSVVNAGEEVPSGQVIDSSALDHLKCPPELRRVVVEASLSDDDTQKLPQCDLRRDIVSALFFMAKRAGRWFRRLFGHGSSPCAPGAGMEGGGPAETTRPHNHIADGGRADG